MRSHPVAALVSACVGAGLLAACGGSDVGGGDLAVKEAGIQNYQRWSSEHAALAESSLPGERGAGARIEAPAPGASGDTPAPAPAPIGAGGMPGGNGGDGGNGGGYVPPSASPAPAPSPAPGGSPRPSPAPAPAPSAGGSNSPAPAPSSPSPAPAPSAGKINSVDTVINDMKLMNDQQLAGVNQNAGWAKGPGHVVMGAEPRGTNTPSWWTVNDKQYKSGTWWQAMLPWFVVFDGVGNGATNTRVQLRDMKLYLKSKSRGVWELKSHSSGRLGGELYPKSLTGANTTSPNLRVEADGSTSVLPPGGDLVFHGWDGFTDIDGADVAGVFITLQARLALNNASGPDDRSKARYLVHVGGDYYPTRNTRVTDLAPSYYFPGIGVSRAKLVTNEWQSFSFASVDVGVKDPGGGVMSEAQFRANPPPLD